MIEKPGQRPEEQKGERRDHACGNREKFGDMDPVHGRNSTDRARTFVDLAQAGGHVTGQMRQKLIASPSAQPCAAGPNL